MSTETSTTTKTFGKGTREKPYNEIKAAKWYPTQDESKPKKVSIRLFGFQLGGMGSQSKGLDCGSKGPVWKGRAHGDSGTSLCDYRWYSNTYI